LEVGLRQAESLAALKKKVQAHQQAEQGLRNRNKKLEELVRERTTALEKAHQRLTRNREKSQKRIAVLAKANQRLVQNQQKLLQSQQKLFQSQQKYQWQATRDSLTELYNRREFERRLEKARTASQTSPQEHVVCLLDLDHFKIVNDTCGHAAGDKLLQQISVLLQSDLRETDILARLGGDEFVILFHQCSFEQALKAAQRLRERIEAFQFIWEGKVFKIGTSIGITPLNEQTSQLASSVMKAADAACYAAKNQGGNRVCVYQETGSQNNSK
jgi:diguanylate cyclase (GGDEF)-like protein